MLEITLFNNLRKLGEFVWYSMNYCDSKISACVRVTGVSNGNVFPERLTRRVWAKKTLKPTLTPQRTQGASRCHNQRLLSMPSKQNHTGQNRSFEVSEC